MLNISKYLEKFKRNLDSGEILNNTIVDIVKKYTKIELKPLEFEIKNNQIILKTSPGVKNKIFISKEEIVRDIEENSALINVDIR